MKILVINAGSSSLKFELFDATGGLKSMLRGLAERIGEGEGIFHAADTEITAPIPDHQTAMRMLKEYLEENAEKFGSPDEIRMVGHRVVHGGNTFMEPTLITNRVKDKIRSLFHLAPLHNPANLKGIEMAEKFFPAAKQVAVFDTAFHQSIPEREHRYAIPGTYYRQGIRQYGFHGISHQYVSRKAAELLGRNDLRLITLHLGNGASMAAVKNGKSMATTMGFGPLAGLVMGTRSGDIDPSVLLYLLRGGMSVDDLDKMLNKQSGLKALFGSNDMRDLEAGYASGDPKARLALEIYTGRIRKYVGAYMALLGGVDALVFTAGIGEHSALVREKSVEGLDFAGIRIDKRKNQYPGKYGGEIQADGSPVKMLVIPTREEQEIARQCLNLAHEIL